MANVPGLPQDIWWLVMRELSNRHDPDFVALYHCALVSKALAGLALPQLYRCGERRSPLADNGPLSSDMPLKLTRIPLASMTLPRQ